jgi:exonuclease III
VDKEQDHVSGFRILTVNGNCWRSIEDQIVRYWSDHHIILVQETRICRPNSVVEHDKLAKSLKKLQQAGYRVWHNYARRTTQGGVSSGVAIVYKAHLDTGGCRDFLPHMASGLFVRIAGIGTVCICSIYMDVHGEDHEKGTAVAGMVDTMEQEGIDHVWIGGDWNTTPALMQASMPVGVRGQFVTSGGPTCRTKTSKADNQWTETQLDYFWMSHKDRVAVQECQLETRGHTSPHMPVSLTVRTRGHKRVEVLERPKLAKQAMYGPLPEEIIQDAEALLRQAQHMAQECGIQLDRTRPVQVPTPGMMRQLDSLAEQWRLWATRYLQQQYQLPEDQEVHSEPQVRVREAHQVLAQSGVDRQQEVRLVDYMNT